MKLASYTRGKVCTVIGIEGKQVLCNMIMSKCIHLNTNSFKEYHITANKKKPTRLDVTNAF